MALGSALDALFEDNAVEGKETQTLRMSEIEPNKSQPRKDFNEEALRELAESIREHGLIQPIIVRPLKNGMTYQIVAGERRWRACRIAGLNEIPVIIRDLDDSEVSQIAIIENVQRTDLNPMEEAAAYKELVSEYGMTQEAVAKAIGKSRPYISNAIRLLNMPETVQTMVSRGELSLGHAKALLGLNDKKRMAETADMVIGENLNVRQTERLISKINSEDEPQSAAAETFRQHNYYTEMELGIREKTGRKVKISARNDGRGSITIDFYDENELARIAESLIVTLTDE